MHAFEVLADPVRRRILDCLVNGEQAAGEVGAAIQGEFGLSQPAVSMHLRVLRDNGFATVRVDGTRRIYAVNPAPLQEVDRWLTRYRHFWTQHLDALGAELERGKREGRTEDDANSLSDTSNAAMKGKEDA